MNAVLALFGALSARKSSVLLPRDAVLSTSRNHNLEQMETIHETAGAK